MHGAVSLSAVVTLADGGVAEATVTRLHDARLHDTAVGVALLPCDALLCATQLPGRLDDDGLRRAVVERCGAHRTLRRCFLMRDRQGERSVRRDKVGHDQQGV